MRPEEHRGPLLGVSGRRAFETEGRENAKVWAEGDAWNRKKAVVTVAERTSGWEG